MANKQKSDDFETVAALAAVFKVAAPPGCSGLVDFTDFDDDGDDGEANFSFSAFLPDLVALVSLDDPFVADADLVALADMVDPLATSDLLDPSCLFIPCVFEFA